MREGGRGRGRRGEGGGGVVFFFEQKTAYEIGLVTGVQTCALPIWVLRYGCHQGRGLVTVKTDRVLSPARFQLTLAMYDAGVF